MTRYVLVDRSGTVVCSLVVRDACVDCAPDHVGFVRSKPWAEALALLRAADLHAVEEGLWDSISHGVR